MASKKNRPPIPDPFSVDYSPTDRAICKGCDGRLAEGSLRLLKKVWSPWHDGFDLHKYHLRCGAKFVKNLQEVTGWQRLRWDDVLKVAQKFGETIQEDHPVVQSFKKRSTYVWQLADLLQEVPKKQLLAILDANEIYYNEKKISVLDAAQWIADGIFFGRLPPCPICETRALVQEGCQLRCRGYMPASSTRCCFRFTLQDLLSPSAPPTADASSAVDASALTRTELFILPPEAQRMPLFRQWKAPADFSEGFKLGNPLRALQQQKSKAVFDSEAEDEAAVPKKKELAGLKFASIGATNPPKQQLVKLINSHGGVFEEALDPKTDFLLVHDEESTAAKHTQRYQDALRTGVPIMRCCFVSALVSRKNVQPALPLAEAKKKIKTQGFQAIAASLPKGLLLRQRKYAAYYVVEGQLSRPLQRVAAAVEEQKTAAAASLSNATRVRPRIRPNSPLLTVDPLFTLKGNCSIYVDKYRNAYNVSTQFTDIVTGVNKYYNIQLIKRDKTTYFLFTKWGRLGEDHKTTNDYRQISFGTSLQRAIAAFEAKFHGLTGVHFGDRMEAKQQPGRYAIVELDGYMHEDLPLANEAAAEEGEGGAAAASSDGEAALFPRQNGLLQQRVKKEEQQEDKQQQQEQQQRDKQQQQKRKKKEERGQEGRELSEKKEQRETSRDTKRSSTQKKNKKTASAVTDVKKQREEKDEQSDKEEERNNKKIKLTATSNVKSEVKSKLHPAVQQLIKIIFDTEMTKKALKEQHLNLQRMPIHSISRRQLSEGYAILQEIQKLLQEPGEQHGTDKFKIKIADATNRFYNKIPHVFERSALPPVIDTLAKLRAKVEMMEQLLDVCVAHSLIKGALKDCRELHPLDAQYEQLHCTIEPVARNSEEWKLIETMLVQTRPPTHNTWSLQLQHLFRCSRNGELQLFDKSLGDRRLLWHGSRLTNWPSVIARGLQIAPPEAPSSGYMFGKGLYFADMASKSSQYCFATSKNPLGLMLLAEVALGKPLYKLEADDHADIECIEKGYNSVWGLGKSCVDSKGDVLVNSAVDEQKALAKTGNCVSNRALIEEVKKELGTDTDATLLYNEYVVYRTVKATRRTALAFRYM